MSNFKIGDIELDVQPIHFQVSSYHGTNIVPTVRTFGNVVLPTPDVMHEYTISIEFSDAYSVNTKLRPLIAMFMRSPFVPIQSEWFNDLVLQNIFATLNDKESTNPYIEFIKEHHIGWYMLLEMTGGTSGPRSMNVSIKLLPFNIFALTSDPKFLQSWDDVVIIANLIDSMLDLDVIYKDPYYFQQVFDVLYNLSKFDPTKSNSVDNLKTADKYDADYFRGFFDDLKKLKDKYYDKIYSELDYGSDNPRSAFSYTLDSNKLTPFQFWYRSLLEEFRRDYKNILKKYFNIDEDTQPVLSLWQPSDDEKSSITIRYPVPKFSLKEFIQVEHKQILETINELSNIVQSGSKITSGDFSSNIFGVISDAFKSLQNSLRSLLSASQLNTADRKLLLGSSTRTFLYSVLGAASPALRRMLQPVIDGLFLPDKIDINVMLSGDLIKSLSQVFVDYINDAPNDKIKDERIKEVASILKAALQKFLGDIFWYQDMFRWDEIVIEPPKAVPISVNFSLTNKVVPLKTIGSIIPFGQYFGYGGASFNIVIRTQDPEFIKEFKLMRYYYQSSQYIRASLAKFGINRRALRTELSVSAKDNIFGMFGTNWCALNSIDIVPIPEQKDAVQITMNLTQSDLGFDIYERYRRSRLRFNNLSRCLYAWFWACALYDFLEDHKDYMKYLEDASALELYLRDNPTPDYQKGGGLFYTEPLNITHGQRGKGVNAVLNRLRNSLSKFKFIMGIGQQSEYHTVSTIKSYDRTLREHYVKKINTFGQEEYFCINPYYRDYYDPDHTNFKYPIEVKSYDKEKERDVILGQLYLPKYHTELGHSMLDFLYGQLSYALYVLPTDEARAYFLANLIDNIVNDLCIINEKAGLPESITEYDRIQQLTKDITDIIISAPSEEKKEGGEVSEEIETKIVSGEIVSEIPKEKVKVEPTPEDFYDKLFYKVDISESNYIRPENFIVNLPFDRGNPLEDIEPLIKEVMDDKTVDFNFKLDKILYLLEDKKYRGKAIDLDDSFMNPKFKFRDGRYLRLSHVYRALVLLPLIDQYAKKYIVYNENVPKNFKYLRDKIKSNDLEYTRFILHILAHLTQESGLINYCFDDKFKSPPQCERNSTIINKYAATIMQASLFVYKTFDKDWGKDRMKEFSPVDSFVDFIIDKIQRYFKKHGKYSRLIGVDLDVYSAFHMYFLFLYNVHKNVRIYSDIENCKNGILGALFHNDAAYNGGASKIKTYCDYLDKKGLLNEVKTYGYSADSLNVLYEHFVVGMKDYFEEKEKRNPYEENVDYIASSIKLYNLYVYLVKYLGIRLSPEKPFMWDNKNLALLYYLYVPEIKKKEIPKTVNTAIDYELTGKNVFRINPNNSYSNIFIVPSNHDVLTRDSDPIDGIVFISDDYDISQTKGLRKVYMKDILQLYDVLSDSNFKCAKQYYLGGINVGLMMLLYNVVLYDNYRNLRHYVKISDNKAKELKDVIIESIKNTLEFGIDYTKDLVNDPLVKKVYSSIIKNRSEIENVQISIDDADYLIFVNERNSLYFPVYPWWVKSNSSIFNSSIVVKVRSKIYSRYYSSISSDMDFISEDDFVKKYLGYEKPEVVHSVVSEISSLNNETARYYPEPPDDKSLRIIHNMQNAVYNFIADILNRSDIPIWYFMDGLLFENEYALKFGFYIFMSDIFSDFIGNEVSNVPSFTNDLGSSRFDFNSDNNFGF